MRDKFVSNHRTFFFSFVYNLEGHHKRSLIMSKGFYTSVKDSNALLKHFVQSHSMQISPLTTVWSHSFKIITCGFSLVCLFYC